MKKKLIILVLVVLVAAGGAYKFAFARSSGPPPKIPGTIYVLPKEFLVNLKDGHFAKVSVALVLAPSEQVASSAEATPPPDGFGPLEEEAAVRDIVTDQLTGETGQDLISRSGRDALKARILKAIKETTDVKANRVLFTDVAVQ